MNTMVPYGGTLLTEVLIHASFLLIGCAFLFRNILWLRVLAILSNLCVLAAAYRAGMGPNWIIVAWAAAFVAINAGHTTWLLYERYFTRLTEEEKRLFETAFQELDPVSVRKLLRLGTWQQIEDRATLVWQGVHLDRLQLIAEGEACVLLGGRIAARLKVGRFVGEIAYLSGEPATATVTANSPVKCMVWEKQDLERACKRRPELLQVLQAAVGRDLAGKIASHNLAASEAGGGPRPAPA